jgi:hypothetical protein
VKLFFNLFISVVALLMGLNVNASSSEKILGLKVGEKGIEFIVYSGGCTQKKHFKVLKSGQHSGPLELDLIRIQKKYCYGHIPFGVSIFFSYQELGMSPETTKRYFVVKNDLAKEVFDLDEIYL